MTPPLRHDPPPGSPGPPRRIPESFWVLADELQEGVALVHAETISWCNRALSELSGYVREDLIGMSWEQLVTPEERPALRQMMEEYQAGRHTTPSELEVDGQRKDGRAVRIAVSIRVTTLEGEGVLLVLARNVTERRRTEERVRMQHDLALALGTATGLLEALKLSTEPTLKLTEMDGMGVFLAESGGSRFRLLHAAVVPDEAAQALASLGPESRIIGQLRSGQTVYAGPEDLELPAPLVPALTGIAGLALVPLRQDDRFVGFMALTSRSQAVFPAQKRDTIETLTVYLSQAILRKLFELELQESEDKFRTLAEELADGVALYMDDKLVWVNQTALKITGYRAVEILGRDLDVIFSPEVFAELKQRSRDHLFGRPVPSLYQSHFLRKDGTRVDLEINVQRITLQGRPALVSIFRDITERKRTEDALRVSEERFRKIVETAPSMLHITDAQGHNKYVSPNSVEVTGWAPEELLGKWVWWVHPDDQPRVREAVDRSMREGTGGRNFEYKGQRKNGEVWYASASWVPMIEDGRFQGLLIQTVDITARRQAEERLHLTQFAIDHFSEPVYWILEDGTIEYVNEAACRETGYSQEELRRIKIYELDPNFNAETWPGHWERLRQQGSRTFETLHRAKTGEIIPVEVSANYFEYQGRAYHCSFVRDIRERKRAEAALRMTQFSLDHSPDLVYWLDHEGKLLYANEAICALLGYSREEMVALTVFDLDPTLTREHWQELWENNRAQALTFEVINRTKSGEDIPLEVTGYHVIYGDQEFISSFGRDIRERKRQEAEERRLQEGMLQTQKLESLGVLAGGIAHDFNNLLMGMLGHTSLLLLDLPSDSPMRQSLLQIENETRRAAELTNQLLAYSGRGRFVVQPLDLSWLVQDSIDLLKLTVSKKARLACQLEQGLPAVEGEATQLRQVIMNLVTNASDALGDQEGVITLRTRLQEVGPEDLSGMYIRTPLAPGRYVVLEVLDTGSGMDEETRRRIFDPFFTTKFTGRGLGLAAVLGIVHGHKGGIQVISAPGRGTTFRILLPCAVAEARIPEASKPVAARRGQGTVLVVDDEASVRTVVQIILEEYGFKVLMARDGRQALDLVRSLEMPPAVVLLDLTMPGLNGFETFQELRRLHPDIKVVLSSGYTEQESMSQFSGQGLAGFIQKPYHAEALVSKINEVLG